MTRKNSIDVGMKFGRLTTKECVGTDNKNNKLWLCDCECGGTNIVKTTNLKQGKIRSCGCLAEEARKTHGLTGTKEYKIWAGMKSRCYNKKELSYKYYGARGIVVCDEWKNDFTKFIADMGPRPEGFSIERIDVYGNYEPSNCKWADNHEQGSNRRNNRKITYNGKTQTLSEWATEMELTVSTLYVRLDKLGWTVEKALSTPPSYVTSYKKPIYEYKGEMYTIDEICESVNILPGTFYDRLGKGWTIEQIVETPVKKRKVFTYKGKDYSIAKLRELSGISEKTLQYRLSHGWSIEDAVETPVVRKAAN